MSTRRVPDSDGRDVVVGLVVTAGRAGVSTGKVVIRPMRALTRLPVFRARVHELASTGQEVGSDARKRAEQVAGDALAGDQTRRIVERVVHDVLERDKIVDRVVTSPQFEDALKRVMTSPAVREALLAGTTTIGDQIVDHIRRSTRRFDRTDSSGYGGFATRAVALMLDALLVAIAYLTGVALIGLVVAMVGRPPTWVDGTLIGVAWFAVQIVYFAGGWWLAGTTLGMALLGLRVVGPGGVRLGPARAVVRLIGLWLSIALLFLGFLPVLVDRRRRALQDFLAHTLVLDTFDAGSPAGVASVPADAATPDGPSRVTA